MRYINVAIALTALLLLSGCAATTGTYHPGSRSEVRHYGNRSGLPFDVNMFLMNRTGPDLQFQNQAGGWESVVNRGRIVLQINQGGMTFHIIPNGHFVGYDATLDGVPIGGGGDLFFGFSTGTHDGGKHLLVVNVQRKFSPLLGDPVPEEIIESHTFRVIIDYKATW